jgi:DNA (cytosine-5)-methyltransferase 1
MWQHMARIIGEVRPRFAFVENSPALVTRGLGRVLGDLAALGYDCRWTVLGAADVGAPHQRDRFWLVGSETDIERRREARGFRPYSVVGSGRFREVVAHAENDRIGRGKQQPEGCEETRDVADPNGSRELQPQGRKPDQRGRACDGGEDMAHTDSPQLKGGGAPIRIQAQHPNIGRSSWWKAEPDVGRVADGVAARVDRLKAIGNGQVPQCAAEAWRLLSGVDVMEAAA